MRFMSQPVRVTSFMGVFAVTVAFHLAEEVAGPEVGHVLAVARDLGLPVLDRHELVREVAFTDQLTSLVHRHVLREASNLRELLVGHVREQG